MNIVGELAGLYGMMDSLIFELFRGTENHCHLGQVTITGFQSFMYGCESRVKLQRNDEPKAGRLFHGQVQKSD